MLRSVSIIKNKSCFILFILACQQCNGTFKLKQNITILQKNLLGF